MCPFSTLFRFTCFLALNRATVLPITASCSRGVPAPDCVEISMSCPWVSHCAGGGVVTYRLPTSTILGAVLADFCHLAGLLPRAGVCRWPQHLFREENDRNNCCSYKSNLRMKLMEQPLTQFATKIRDVLWSWSCLVSHEVCMYEA